MSDGTNDFMVVKGEKVYIDKETETMEGVASWLELGDKNISSPSDIEGLDKTHAFTHIRLDNNNLRELPDLSQCPWIKGISADNNKIKSISGLATENQLEWIALCDNPLEDITGLKECSNLKSLRIQNTPLESLAGVEHCTKIEVAWLCNNAINDISPLSKCTNLERLYLNRNEIESLEPLVACKKLFVLEAKHNKITTLEGIHGNESLPELFELNVVNNNIDRITIDSSCLEYFFALENPIEEVVLSERVKKKNILKDGYKIEFKMFTIPNLYEKFEYILEWIWIED